MGLFYYGVDGALLEAVLYEVARVKEGGVFHNLSGIEGDTIAPTKEQLGIESLEFLAE